LQPGGWFNAIFAAQGFYSGTIPPGYFAQVVASPYFIDPAFATTGFRIPGHAQIMPVAVMQCPEIVFTLYVTFAQRKAVGF
jgi:hypothetical protein